MNYLPNSQPGPESPLTSLPSFFGRLPLKVFRNITDRLDYTSYLNFSTLSRYLYLWRIPRRLPARRAWFQLNPRYMPWAHMPEFPIHGYPALHCPACECHMNYQLWFGYYGYGLRSRDENPLYVVEPFVDQRIGVVSFEECSGMFFRIPSQMLWSWQCHACTKVLEQWGLGGRAQPRRIPEASRQIVKALAKGAYWGDSEDPRTWDDSKTLTTLFKNPGPP